MKFKPPNEEAQGRDFEHSRQARLEALPESRLAPQKYLALAGRGKGSLSCAYCQEFLTQADDAQRISRGSYAHTICAFGADADGWNEIETINATKPSACNPGFCLKG